MVCHPVDIFQKQTGVFPTAHPNQDIFLFKLPLQPRCDTERGLVAQPGEPAKHIFISWCRLADKTSGDPDATAFSTQHIMTHLNKSTDSSYSSKSYLSLCSKHTTIDY